MKCEDDKLPTAWTIKPLGTMCEVVRGGSPRPIMNYLTTSPTGVNWLKIGDVGETDKYFTRAAERIKPEGTAKSRKVERGDLLLSNSMSFGRAFITLIDGYIHDGWLRLRSDERVLDKEYLYYFLLSPFAQNQFKSIATGSVVANLKSETVKALEVILPPLPEQKRIAAILSSLDDKIELNNKINANLEQQAQALFKAWFVDFEPFGGKMPEDWRCVTLGEVVTISKRIFSPSAVSEMQLEHYSIPAFDEGRFPVFEFSTSVKSNKFIVDKDCFMISKLNPTTKRVWRPYCLSGTAVCSTEFIVYKAKDVNMTDFLYSVIDSVTFSDFMCSHATGSTGSRQRTNPSETLAFELVVPSDDKLLEFQSIVAPMYAQIRTNAIENDRLRRIRDAVLPRLMSGEVDVSDVSFPKL